MLMGQVTLLLKLMELDDASVVIFIDSSNNGDLNPGEVVVDTININPKDDNDLDEWSIAAKYGIQGFSLGALITVSRINCPKTQRELLVKIGMLGSSKPVMVKITGLLEAGFPKIMLPMLMMLLMMRKNSVSVAR